MTELLKRFTKIQEKYRTTTKSNTPYSIRFGAEKKQKITICVGLHGNETAPISAMISFLEKYGEILNAAELGSTFIIGNPKAVEKNIRYTEKDLNRVFGSSGTTYEEQRSKELIELTKNTEFLLDIHQTIEPTQKPFGAFPRQKELIAFFESLAIAEDIIVTGSLNDGTTLCFDEYVLSKHNICAITIEVGSIAGNQEESIERATKAIRNALEYVSILPRKKKETQKSTFWKQTQRVLRTETTKLVPNLENMMPIKKGFVLSKIPTTITAEEDGIILFPKYVPTTDKYIVRIATHDAN